MLSLSGGVLFSTLRHPTYVRQPVPGASDPVLGINGGAQPTPYIVGLLNYKMPYFDPWKDVGLAISTGPVLRVGGDTNTSAFGYFNGISVHFWHRLFVTFGSHVGQFADIPTGFKIGQTIPASFGQLTPSNRWSARFAIAVTYKTNNLSALTSSSKDSTAPPSKTPAPKTPTTVGSNDGGTKSAEVLKSDSPSASQSSSDHTALQLRVAQSAATTADPVPGNPAVPLADGGLQVRPSILRFPSLKSGVANRLLVEVTDSSSGLKIHAKIAARDYRVEQIECVRNECDVVISYAPAAGDRTGALLRLVAEDGRFVDVPIAVSNTK